MAAYANSLSFTGAKTQGEKQPFSIFPLKADQICCCFCSGCQMSLKTVAAWQPDSPAGSTDYSHKHAAIQKKLPSLQANKSAPVQRVSSFALIAENSISVCFFFQVLWEPESLLHVRSSSSPRQ